MRKTIDADCGSARPYRLKNSIQHYSWGTRGDKAYIPHLLNIAPEDDLAFAELWMGVHPNAPSMVIDPESELKILSDWIAEAPSERLSTDRSNDFPEGLPYLLKVLSVGQALSIQAHPNKAQAESLHKNDPEHYPDANHKPEMAIAIDHLITLVGFISNKQMATLFLDTPELRTLVEKNGTKISDLKSVVMKLLEFGSSHPGEIESCVSALQSRLRFKDNCNETELLFLEQAELNDPHDIGLLFLFFLNLIHFKPGEALFLPPGVPHAYLKGNIIECMANSDNVVRLGLTEKFCDAPALTEILVFDETTDFLVETSSDGYITEYACPTSEFRIKSLDLPQAESTVFSLRSELTMFLILEGEISLNWESSSSACMSIYRRGDSFITPANLSEFSLQAKTNAKLYLVEIPNR
ncbi:mannose-6-phosphate isomerase, class I [bacterium]|nr:mannose-6-phosphate isomerase, class I [bacterium]